MTNQFPDATKMVLSPAAQAVLTAATQKLYCLDPEDVPMIASEYGSAIAAALRAAADHADRFHPLHGASEWGNGWGEGVHDTALGLRSIATELERFSN